MYCSLMNHKKRYDLNVSDCLTSVATGFSGCFYAQRHWELSEKNGSQAHMILGFLEALPLLGFTIAILERLAVILFDDSKNLSHLSMTLINEKKGEAGPWQPAALTIDKDIAQKMLKNAEKAVDEHQEKDRNRSYMSKDAIPSLERIIQQKQLPPLKFTYEDFGAQGIRDSMEDAHFFEKIDQGVIAGVFDGHGGKEVAEYASQNFKLRFSQTLKEAEGNVHEAFKTIIDEIHQEVAQKKTWNKMGSTAVIVFIDPHSHLIYTATIADSEANIYRKNQKELKSIPLSCVRDWSSPKDAKRAAEALHRPEIATLWPQRKSKDLRFPLPNAGLNVSRAIGDVFLTWTRENKPGLIHKPKITVNQVQTGDILILACDGLKDFASEKEIIQQISQHDKKANLAEKLVHFALNEKQSSDNVTVLAIEVN